MVFGSSADSRTRHLLRRTSRSTRSVASMAWQSPSRWRGEYAVCSIACTPANRMRRVAVVPSRSTSTSIVSPSLTDFTFAVQTWHVGPATPGTHAPLRASAAAGSAARTAAASTSGIRRRTICGTARTGGSCGGSAAHAAAHGALRVADRPHHPPRDAPAQVALPAGPALGDAPVRRHRDHQVLGAAGPAHAPGRAEPADDRDGAKLPQRRPAAGRPRRPWPRSPCRWR